MNDPLKSARTLTFGPKGKRYTPCPYCGARVKASKFEKHIRLVHTGDCASPQKLPKVKIRAVKRTDALRRSVSGGRSESNRRKH